MSKSLVIVESPAKAKTISKYLGNEYIVKSSVGHIRDLPKGKSKAKRQNSIPKDASPEEKARLKKEQERRRIIRRMGVNPDDGWTANYEIIPDKEKVIKDLRKASKEVEKVFGITPGIIGSGKFEIDAPIVIGNTQTLYRNLPAIRKAFGTVILDEMHHVSSPTFSKIIDSNYCRYKLGLSGTIERKDGKHVVFRDYFGQNVYKPPKENFMSPSVHVLKSEIRFMDGNRTPWATRVSALASNEEYLHTVSMLAAAYAARGHKVLVVSDRVFFLKACAELAGEKAICITGEVSHEDREKHMSEIRSGKKDILFGTQAIFSEGISLNNLSCLILGTPINNEPLLTQLVGRVIRKEEGKLDPVIIDIHLKGNTARRQASNRMGHYMKQGYDIKQL